MLATASPSEPCCAIFLFVLATHKHDLADLRFCNLPRHQEAKHSEGENAKYESMCLVGEGTYGFVFKAKERASQKKVAIKKFKATKEGEGISLTAYREIMLLREIDHENIIKVRDVAIHPEEKTLSLIMDYAEYDLSEIIRYHHHTLQTPPTPYSIKSCLWQVLNAIHYLHSNWICHRDLKPSNILVMAEGPEQGLVKIADFGLARIFQSPLRPLCENGVVVTIWYRAPELLFGSKHYTRSVDVWAIGCIFAELLTTNPLFPGKEKDTKNPNLFQDVQIEKLFQVLGKPNQHMWPDINALPDWKTKNPSKWKGTLIEKKWNQYPEAHPDNLRKVQNMPNDNHAFDLLSRMLEYDPTKRINTADALDHPYFKEDPLPGANMFRPAGSKYAPAPYPARQPMKAQK
ncbi:protein serine/threonine kinase [Planoprotostelium fungivorum]|uniref:Protein serine/threonine kinase n=1 Tax=Planoprotostelium fungivorum TaxID=1890364 RepID=A0A2P6N0U1_9EUKA|nr:protein serine/threonine kinase [Planoprotostelium fungivorum]